MKCLAVLFCLIVFSVTGCGPSHGYVRTGNHVLVSYDDSNTVVVKNNIGGAVLTNLSVGGNTVAFEGSGGTIKQIELTTGQEISVGLGYTGQYSNWYIEVKADVYDLSGQYLGLAVKEIPLRHSWNGNGYGYTELVSKLCVIDAFKPVRSIEKSKY